MSDYEFLWDSISTGPDGRLMCDHSDHEKRVFKCEHLKTYMTSSADAPNMYDRNRILVPISLSKRGTDLQIPVMFKAQKPRPLAEGEIGTEAEAYIVHRSPFAGDREEYLGLLSPGEGRLILRSMIKEWLFGLHPQEEIHLATGVISTACRSKIHGVPAQKWITKPHPLWEVIECLWYIEMEDCCTYCWKSAGVHEAGFTESDLGGGHNREYLRGAVARANNARITQLGADGRPKDNSPGSGSGEASIAGTPVTHYVMDEAGGMRQAHNGGVQFVQNQNDLQIGIELHKALDKYGLPDPDKDLERNLKALGKYEIKPMSKGEFTIQFHTTGIDAQKAAQRAWEMEQVAKAKNALRRGIQGH